MTDEHRKQAVQYAAAKLMGLAQQHMVEDDKNPAWRTCDFATGVSYPASESKGYHLGTARQTIDAAFLDAGTRVIVADSIRNLR